MNIPIHELGRPDVQEKYGKDIDNAIFQNPNNPDVYILKAVCLLNQGDFEGALEYAKMGVGLEPTFAGHYVTLSVIYGNMGDEENYGNSLKHGLSLGPDVPGLNWNYSMWLLKHGMFKEGWEKYRWRKIHLPGHKRHIKEEWNHTKPVNENETLMVWAEQGLGDQVMFFRFLKQIKERFPFKKVHFECSDHLYTLFHKNVENVDLVYTQSKDLNCPYDFDQHCSLMDLPWILGIDTKKDFGSEPYIKIDPLAIQQWKNGMDEAFPKGKPRIGICWRGTPGHSNDHNRSATLSDFMPLVDKGHLIAVTKEGYDEVPDGMKLFNVSQGMVNCELTGGLIANLDVVVTVDTFVAHLAGSMGKKTFLLLPYVPEWRWGDGVGKSYLYKSVEMIKQTKYKDWSGPMQEVVKKL